MYVLEKGRGDESVTFPGLGEVDETGLVGPGRTRTSREETHLLFDREFKRVMYRPGVRIVDLVQNILEGGRNVVVMLWLLGVICV